MDNSLGAKVHEHDVTGARVTLNRTIYRTDGLGVIARGTSGTVKYPLDSVGRKCLWVQFDTGVAQLVFLKEVVFISAEVQEESEAI